jgi:hypothetical protein
MQVCRMIVASYHIQVLGLKNPRRESQIRHTKGIPSSQNFSHQSLQSVKYFMIEYRQMYAMTQNWEFLLQLQHLTSAS